VNGLPVPYVTRLAATNGAVHTVELDALSLRLTRAGRFHALVRYRHAAWERHIARDASFLEAGFHGRYVLDPSGALTLYPDPGTSGRRRPAWHGTLSGDRVVFRHSISAGAQTHEFLFDLEYDRSIY